MVRRAPRAADTPSLRLHSLARLPQPDQRACPALRAWSVVCLCRKLCSLGWALLLVRLHAGGDQKKGGPLELHNFWRGDRRRACCPRGLACCQPVCSGGRCAARHDRGPEHLPHEDDGRHHTTALRAPQPLSNQMLRAHGRDRGLTRAPLPSQAPPPYQPPPPQQRESVLQPRQPQAPAGGAMVDSAPQS